MKRFIWSLGPWGRDILAWLCFGWRVINYTPITGKANDLRWERWIKRETVAKVIE